MVQIGSGGSSRRGHHQHRSGGGGLFCLWVTLGILFFLVGFSRLFLVHPNSLAWEKYLATSSSSSSSGTTTISSLSSSDNAPGHQRIVKDDSSSSSPSSTSKSRKEDEEGASHDVAHGNGDSSTASVMALATGYGLDQYHKFVGSLRKSGFRGHIVLGIAPDASKEIVEYLRARRVTPKIIDFVNCSYDFRTPRQRSENPDNFKLCAPGYPNFKIQWGRFPLIADWIRECPTCTGPILVTDVRDVYFQMDPFGSHKSIPPVEGLQVFEEHKNITTTNWIVSAYVAKCKGHTFDEPMLCSGTTIGTRNAMLQYLDAMHEEMKVWMANEKCHDLGSIADDQAIHNYVYYSHKLDHVDGGAKAIPNRMGIVHTVGWELDKIRVRHVKWGEDVNKTETDVMNEPFRGATETNWLGIDEFGLTDDHGYFTNFDGTRSPVVHQFDRGGQPFSKWYHNQPFQKDSTEEALKEEAKKQ